MDGNPLLDELTRKLELLSQRQQQFQQEIADLKKSIAELRAQSVRTTADEKVPPIVPVKETPPVLVKKIDDEPLPALKDVPLVNLPPFKEPTVLSAPKVNVKTPIEEFIGTNLLNKIGIAVLIIGVGIGVEYAIDHDLINPLTRIILGYLCGIALIGVALRLKAKYANFSAVLLSGGMAVLYFITFAAYDLYALFPRGFAFVLMLVFTAFTVFAALQYGLQVIAIIGLVGAYGVPFLLSNNTGNVAMLFAYITIVNGGILFLGFKKSWRLLNYLAFVFTWLIFAVWFVARYYDDHVLWTSLGFSTIFFVTFYATVLAYKLIRGESLTKKDISFVLINSFVYYGFGYAAISDQPDGELYLGIFTVFNAILHFLVCFVIFKSQAQSRSIFLFAAGLVLVFLTLAVPVQLNGNWVTIVWAAEAVLLFWLGRTKNYRGYEKLSYPLMLLALGSLLHDWSSFYGSYYYYATEAAKPLPFLNIQLLTSLLVCTAMGVIIKINRDSRFPSPPKPGYIGNDILRVGLPIAFIITLFAAFLCEINLYWDQRYAGSVLAAHTYGSYDQIADEDVLKFKVIWVLNYAAFFMLVLGAVNYFKLKIKTVDFVVVFVSSLVVFLLITAGLKNAADLRYSYLQQTDATYYYRDFGHLLIRYVIVAFVLAILFMNYKVSRHGQFDENIRKAERLFFHFVILALISSELVGGLALLNIVESDKLALSILWGTYALGLIVFGLIRDLKYIRIAAIALFGVTLVKLFFYDMAGMGTISRTIVMIILGVLLLVASFLYNKFKKTADEKI